MIYILLHIDLHYKFYIYRHPESKKRPSFNEIMLLLLKDDSTLLLIPDEDRLTHSDAGQLGASLEAGDKLYTDLQSMYIDEQ